MTTLDLSRLQFATTSIYHFLFVPVTIGLAFLVALLNTAWVRHHDEAYLRLTKFFGTLLLINVAIGVVTGLIQEFEFGMNWSTYSRFVGGVFGAPLAIEGLAAFFLESTFLGLWIFGWGRLPERVHLLTIWAVSLGTALSAAFIMAANSWMQHPVGYQIVDGKAELTSIWAVMSNPVFVWGYLHVLLASLVTGSLIMLAVSAWHLRRGSETEIFHKTAAISIVVLLPAITFGMMVGSHLGVIETTYQPMKVAAMEAQWTNCGPCSFSVIQVRGGNEDETPTKIIEIPHLLSLLATDSWNGHVEGLTSLNQQYQQKYGPGNYVPNVFIQYWSMRVMAYIATIVFLLAAWGVWLLWRRKLETNRWFLWAAVWAVFLPFLMNTAGWMLTENGRQPWIVQGLQLTKNGVSASISATDVWISLSVFVLLYVVFGVIDARLMVRYSKQQLAPAPELDEEGSPVVAMSY
ncbi:MAG TPA: cytochrome ubiquinol oxidase subunit I [Actinomycetota bacterium]|nr:cytochrome ubiquinol oxidase subunit I [Actinomycetota bacterium]